MNDIILEISKGKSASEVFEKSRKISINAVTSGKISHAAYKQFWDSFHQIHTEFSNKNFRRKDYRTLGQFALDLFLNADKEATNFKNWWETHSKPIFGEANYSYFGAEATGMLLFADDTERGNPDFILDNGTKIEYKLNNKTFKKATYKVADLENYLNCGCYVLTEFIKEGQNYGWILMTPKDLKKIWEDIKTEKIEVFKFSGMGYKDSVQFYTKTKAGTEQQSVPLKGYCEYINIT